MRIQTDDYTIECEAARSTMSGVLGLHSPKAYEDVFECVAAGLRASTDAYVLDIAAVKFMNSSGITALSRLVLQARTQKVPLRIVGSEQVAWQKMTLSSLRRLYDGLVIELG